MNGEQAGIKAERVKDRGKESRRKKDVDETLMVVMDMANTPMKVETGEGCKQKEVCVQTHKSTCFISLF